MFLPILFNRSSPIGFDSSTQEYLSMRGTSSNAFLIGTRIDKLNPSLSSPGTPVHSSTLKTPWGLCGGNSDPNISWKIKMKTVDYLLIHE